MSTYQSIGEKLVMMPELCAKDGEHLTLPYANSLEPIKNIRNSLLKETTKLQSLQQGGQMQQGVRQAVPQNTYNGHRVSEFLASEEEFLGRIRNGMKRVLQYENSNIQEKTRSTIPLESLQQEAEENLRDFQNKDIKRDIRDFLLLALLKWFKHSFFKWVDTLPCDKCGGKTQHNGGIQPSSEDLRWGASRVEAHFCTKCQLNTRFPRYTNPERLLSTRRGRCGEWADCFTLCCRALGFEARFVMDWTDHVWTEVYSNSQSRWLHCDPCENICDKPLLYESGWGKKLTYVIAVSKDEVQDVTWRYSAKHEEVLCRRNLCREVWLRHTIHNLWKRQLSNLSQERQNELWLRLIGELSEFISIKKDKENLPGRSTGSVAWRQARGELGSGANTKSLLNTNNSNQNGYVFIPSSKECQSKVIHILYSCSADKYVKKSANNEEHLGWETCSFEQKNMFRKEELDWGMVYLARTEGSTSSQISWKFDLTNTDLRFRRMELKAQSSVFENGKISWRICADDTCLNQTEPEGLCYIGGNTYHPNNTHVWGPYYSGGASLENFTTFDLKGSKTLILTALLQRGQGENAWQHTQLFRQSSQDKETYPFEIRLMLD